VARIAVLRKCFKRWQQQRSHDRLGNHAEIIDREINMIDQTELYSAIIEGAKASKYGRDPQRPDQPGSLTRFMTAIADKRPAAFCALLGAMIEQEVQTELSSEPQQTNSDIVTDGPKPGRLQ
jgi:hypothetical protein